MSEIIVMVAVWFAVACMVLWDSLCGPNREDKRAKRSNDDRGRNIKWAALIARFPSIKHPPDCPEQAKHWYQARRQADFSSYAIVVSFVALIGGWLAFREARVQADAAVADLRPWLKVTLKATDLNWWPKLAGQPPIGVMSPDAIVKNIGRSPAFNARGGVLFYYHGTQTIREVQLKICQRASDGSPEQSIGQTLFPNDDFNLDDPGIGRLGFGIESAHLPLKASAFEFLIVGCVDYMFGAPLAHHQTFFAYGAWHLVENYGNPPHNAMGGFSVGEYVKAADIMLYKLNGFNDAN